MSLQSQSKVDLSNHQEEHFALCELYPGYTYEIVINFIINQSCVM